MVSVPHICWYAKWRCELVSVVKARAAHHKQCCVPRNDMRWRASGQHSMAASDLHNVNQPQSALFCEFLPDRVCGIRLPHNHNQCHTSQGVEKNVSCMLLSLLGIRTGWKDRQSYCLMNDACTACDRWHNLHGQGLGNGLSRLDLDELDIAPCAIDGLT